MNRIYGTGMCIALAFGSAKVGVGHGRSCCISK
jgi:hypothetical protein